jgi:TRAP-type C4-dicarboxylate transport system permease small subunit
MVRKLLWWTACGASAILSIFFLFVGISLCIASYNLNHPHQFILTFFASNLIILISVVVIIAVIIRVISRLRQDDPQSTMETARVAGDSSGSADPINSSESNPPQCDL